MAKIRWSYEAFERVKSIKEYIDKDSPSAAYEFAKGIMNQVENIAQFPQIGKFVYKKPYSNLRMLVWKHYKIYYEYLEAKDVVEIWGIWDSRSMIRVSKK